MCKPTTSVRFNTDAASVASTYSISSSLKQRMWYTPKEIEIIKKGFSAYTEELQQTHKHRRNYMQSVLAQQEEHSEELGTSDEKGLRMMASTLSKPDTKKALQRARLDALDAHEIHLHASLTVKSVEEYSKRTSPLGARRSLSPLVRKTFLSKAG